MSEKVEQLIRRYQHEYQRIRQERAELLARLPFLERRSPDTNERRQPVPRGTL